MLSKSQNYKLLHHVLLRVIPWKSQNIAFSVVLQRYVNLAWTKVKASFKITSQSYPLDRTICSPFASTNKVTEAQIWVLNEDIIDIMIYNSYLDIQKAIYLENWLDHSEVYFLLHCKYLLAKFIWTQRS